MNATGECSGAESVLVSVLELAVSDGFDVVVLCPPGPLVARLPVGSEHIALPRLMPPPSSTPRGRLAALASTAAAWWTARRLIARQVGAPDTHTVVNSLWGVPSVRWAAPGRPFVWLVHDTVHQRRQRAIVRLGTWRVGRRRAGRAVAVSQASADPLEALGLDTVVCPNGVRWPVPAVDPVGLHEPPTVGVLALLTPWKGQSVVLDAVATIPSVRLELAGGQFAGDADYVAALHRRAARTDLTGRVRVLGHVDAVETLGTWDVFVSASTSPEAGPLGVLEAMSVGLPVVVTALGGAPEYVGDAGLVVRPGDPAALAAAITRLLGDDGLRRTLGARARARVAEHYVETTNRRRMFDAVIGTGRASRYAP